MEYHCEWTVFHRIFVREKVYVLHSQEKSQGLYGWVECIREAFKPRTRSYGSQHVCWSVAMEIFLSSLFFIVLEVEGCHRFAAYFVFLYIHWCQHTAPYTDRNSYTYINTNTYIHTYSCKHHTPTYTNKHTKSCTYTYTHTQNHTPPLPPLPRGSHQGMNQRCSSTSLPQY